MTANKRARETVAPPPSGVELRGAISERILQAVLEHRLPPGTKLVEDRLAELFDTSRAQVRDVLARLAEEGVVATIPNRGAFIASPTAEETREVFEARRLIEPALVRRFIAQRDAAALERLRALVKEEERARARQDRPTMVRLSGEFHIRLAEDAGNRMLARSMRALATLTCLAIFLYDAPHATACREDEHELLLAAIARRRADRAAELMLEHLNHIEASLDLSAPRDQAVDLAAALRAR
jgi:DNA-binding GntR family transcriptional regulator